MASSSASRSRTASDLIIRFGCPVEPEVTAGTSYLAFFAYGLATLAAWWMGKSETNPA